MQVAPTVMNPPCSSTGSCNQTETARHAASSDAAPRPILLAPPVFAMSH
jgi:hypothetical protein